MSDYPRYQGVFTDFDYDYIELGEQLGNKWTNTTWKNNSCPSFGICIKEGEYAEVWYSLWFDYKDIYKSEFTEHRNKGSMKRFELTDEMGNYLLQTDNWEDMKKFIEADGVKKHYDNIEEERATDTDG